MPTGQRAVLLWKCLLPALILALLSPLPYSAAVRAALVQAQLAHQRGDPLSEAAQLLLVVEREPWRTGLWEQIGSAQYAAGAVEPAAQALRQAAARGGLSDEGALLLAEIDSAQGRSAQAQEVLLALLQRDAPADIRARGYQRLVEAYQQQGSLSEALPLLRAWQAEQPQNALANYRLGLLLSVLQPADALQPLLAAANLDTAYSARVQVLRRGWNLAQNSTDAAYSALMIGRALGNVNEWGLAAEAFRRALLENTRYAEAWAFLSEALYHLQQAGEAGLQQALLLDPDSTLVRALAAVRYRRLGDPALALEYLRDVARQEPQEPLWQVEIGSTLAQSGDLPAALTAYQRAVEMDPQNTRLWQYLAQFCADYRYDLAGIGIPAARKAVILAPDDPAALDVMGLALLAQGDWATAERFLQHALKQDAAHAPANLHLAMLYLQREQFDKAAPFLRRAASLDSSSAVGQVAARLLRQYYGE